MSTAGKSTFLTVATSTPACALVCDFTFNHPLQLRPETYPPPRVISTTGSADRSAKQFSYTVMVGGVQQAPITGITAGSRSVLSDVTCTGCRQPAAKAYDVTTPTLLLGLAFNLGPDVNALTFTNAVTPQ